MKSEIWAGHSSAIDEMDNNWWSKEQRHDRNMSCVIQVHHQHFIVFLSTIWKHKQLCIFKIEIQIENAVNFQLDQILNGQTGYTIVSQVANEA